MFTRCIAARVKAVVACVLQVGEKMLSYCTHIMWKFAIILWASCQKVSKHWCIALNHTKLSKIGGIMDI